MQDLLKDGLRPGKKGDEILSDVKKAMEKKGLKGLIYGHPIGDYG